MTRACLHRHTRLYCVIGRACFNKLSTNGLCSAQQSVPFALSPSTVLRTGSA